MVLNLSAIRAIVKGNRNLSPADRAFVAGIPAILGNVNKLLQDATNRAQMLPTTQKGFRKLPAAIAANQQRGIRLPAAPRTYHSTRREETVEGVSELRSWTSLTNPVHARGSQWRQQLINMSLEIRNQVAAGHPGRLFYNFVLQLDAQAVFILMQNGFMDRFRTMLGDPLTGEVDTQSLHNTMDPNQFQLGPWMDMVDEVKDARKYNRRVMGNL